MLLGAFLVLLLTNMAPVLVPWLGELPPVSDIQDNINRRFDALFHHDNGELSPYVCSVCDEYISHEKNLNWLPFETLKKNQSCLSWSTLLPLLDEEHIPEIKDEFRFRSIPRSVLRDSAWIQQLALSPRGTYGRKGGNRSKWGISCCSHCKNDVTKGTTPLYAIVNNNFVGCAPTCITELTEVELCMIRPVRGHGYCLTYSGGAQKNLRGTLTFLRVQEYRIAEQISKMEHMGLTKHVVVLLNGKMTQAQRKRAKQEIRTDKVIAAVKWLIQNHRDWQDIDLDVIKEQLCERVPIVVDKSDEVESENANVESRELFSCFVPDGSKQGQTGGFDTVEEFKEYVNEMEKKGFDLQLKFDMQSTLSQETDSEKLVGCCLEQFPYGLCGIEARRRLSDGSYSAKPDTMSFLRHLSMVSNPCFQTSMFQLILYNLYSQIIILKNSRLSLRGEHSAKTLAEGLNSDDLSAALKSRARGYYNAGTPASRLLLKSVNAVSKALPHSNEAAKKARAKAESMMHHFGTGSVFLTVTFDDENSLLMQVLSGSRIDVYGQEFDDVTESELQKMSADRRQLRLKFPGLAALNFDMLFDIVCEEVIGWDRRRNRSTGVAGLFGICEALAAAFEEQGRRTIHGHLTLFIRGLKRFQNLMFFGNVEEKALADQVMATYQDRLATTKLFQGTEWELKKAFDHNCSVPMRERRTPEVVPLQDLRTLRHKKGYDHLNGLFSYCLDCGKRWTYEAMVNDYVRNHLQCKPPPLGPTYCEEDRLAADTMIPKARLQCEMLQYQLNVGAKSEDAPNSAIRALYQHHTSCHVKGCFRCSKKNKKTHTCGPKCECRFRFPDMARPQTCTRTVNECKPWYQWDGSSLQQPIVEFLPERSKYDLFQNVSCPTISESKCTCNTNLSIISAGPVGMYMIKYQHKSTQDDDTAEYSHVERSIKNMNGRKYDDNNREALRDICRAAFAHNKTNVVGAPLAAFLTRHGSRFYFSHEFMYCPLGDIIRLMCNENVTATVKYRSDGDVYFENQALHYLCRPKELEDVSVKGFYENYTVIPYRKPTGKRQRHDDKWPFQAHTGFFQHPSAKQKDDGRFTEPTQGVKENESQGYIQVPQWMFPDTVKFGNNILTCDIEDINESMNEYCKVVMCLFLPLRSPDDLMPANEQSDYPFVDKFREVHAQDYVRRHSGYDPVLFSDENLAFLQNIQDTAYNHLRYKPGDDELCTVTEAFRPDDSKKNWDEDDESDIEEDEEADDMGYDQVFDSIQATDLPTDRDEAFLANSLKNFNFGAFRDRGPDGCGYMRALPLPERSADVIADEAVFVTTDPISLPSTTPFDPEEDIPMPPNPSVNDIIELLLEKSQHRSRAAVFVNNPSASVPDANGSVASIVAWAKGAKLDKVQQRAFECIIASFILTFMDCAFNDSERNESLANLSCLLKLRRARLNLRRLRGSKRSQLICLLHGPGGSGKSTVINLVNAYAREYCDLLGHDFTERTIVICAMSGVAATLLHGETAHSAMGLNRDVEGVKKLMGAWKDTRLVVIDECSFCSGADYTKIFQYLQILKDNKFLPFGGVNVVYAGDFSQLEPVGRNAVYKEIDCPEFFAQLNTYIELDGRHRFKDDPEWGERLFRFRQGNPTKEDVDIINKECLVSATNVPPQDIQVACPFNKERDAVNCALFEDYCKKHTPADGSVFMGGIMILMDDLQMTDGNRKFVPVTSNTVKTHFWSNCGENDAKVETGRSKPRIDPVLKLYPGCPMMLTENKDVSNGQANGSRVFLKQVHVRSGIRPMLITLKNGAVIRAYKASEVRCIQLQHELDDIQPREFQLDSTCFSFNWYTEFDEAKTKLKMKGVQFPIISNSATTGHKLQGYTASSLLVNSWSYKENWAYVVLSRVRTMAGLYLLKPLTTTLKKFEMPRAMKDMINGFRENLSLPEISLEEYDDMIRFENSIATVQ